MLIDCLLSLKRKYFAIADEYDEDEENFNSPSCSPRKRLRVQAPASIDEATQQHRLAASDVALEEEEPLPLVEVNQKETVEELEARVKQLQEMNERIKKEADQFAAKLKKIEDEDVECMICQDMVQNPQMLPCGHSACYGCLRNWWTQPPEEDEVAEIIDTEPEEDTSDVTIIVEGANPEGRNPDPEQQPHLHRRHVFSSVVNRKKICPYCTKEVQHRPVPNLQLRAVVETLRKDLAKTPSSIQPRPPRRDLWHGIFHPGTHSVQQQHHMRMFLPPLGLEPGPPPPLHPDPILNGFAQGQRRMAVEEARARQERERARAFEDGRIIGIIEGRRQRDRERAEQARQVAINGRLGEQGLVPGNAPPIPQQPPVEVPDILQDPVPRILDAAAVPPLREDAL
ncbi:hypothetical protein Clacol_003446 [Clathrus columnatus]|uniref:RING-type domain-containing protein n=1 Tax=Clathrus columnatus TaxID=1419009 RepID=A0AAV5A3I9_9AGAM|nr:hypothetical protein Clacol_003446 [Clathrus columnatus]